MNSLTYDQLLLKLGNENGQVNPDIRAEIIQKASGIISSRRDRSSSIEEAKNRIDSGTKQIKPLVNLIRSDISRVISGEKERDIMTICDNILCGLDTYQSHIDALHRRIHDGKIRVAAIGLARKGKSEFHKRYTGLGEQVFPQSKAKMEDTTGTVVTVQTSNGRQLYYEIVLFDENEVLAIINWYMKEMRKNQTDWTANGYLEFTTIDQLLNCRNNVEYPSFIKDPSIKMGIEYYFKEPINEDWIDLFRKQQLTIDGKTIYIKSKADGRRVIYTEDADLARKFMVMYEPCSFFLATKEVRVYANVNNDDILSYFEVVDTKGFSGRAGAYVSEEIKQAIDESDAVVSICEEDSNSIQDFHNGILGNFRGDQYFKQKHFAIINLFQPEQRSTNVPKAINQLKEYDTTNMAYSGSLIKDDDFANYVIVDLLDSITEVVSKLDTERIKKCNKTRDEIMGNITALGKAVNDLNFGDFDEYSIIRNRVEEIINAARHTIDFYRGKTRSKVVKDNKINTASLVYEKIAGKEPEKSYSNTEKAIEDAVKYRYSTLGFDSRSPYEHKIGGFIQEVAAKFNDVVYRAVYGLSEQEVCIDPLKEEILDKIWKDLLLDKIFEGKDYDWSSEEVSQVNDFFKDLSEIYKGEVKTAPVKVTRLFDSYKILYNYFKDGDDVKIAPNDNKVPEVDHSLLRNTLQDAFREYDIEEKITEREENKEGIAFQTIELIASRFTAGENIEKDCLDFYSLHKNIILNQGDKDNIERNRSWRELKQNIETIKRITIGKLPE